MSCGSIANLNTGILTATAVRGTAISADRGSPITGCRNPPMPRGRTSSDSGIPMPRAQAACDRARALRAHYCHDRLVFEVNVGLPAHVDRHTIDRPSGKMVRLFARRSRLATFHCLCQ